MKRNNIYLYNALDIMDKIKDLFNIQCNEKDKYASILKEFSECIRKDGNNVIDKVLNNKPCFKEDIKDFIVSLDIKNLDYKIGKFILNQDNISIDKNKSNINTRIDDIKNIYLIKFLVKILKGVTYLQKDNLLLVKYNKSGLYFGYNNLYNCCRGKVLDINSRKIIVYAFDKFFNLNEADETNIKEVRRLLSKAKIVSIMDKLDGTLISTTKHKDKLMVTTNGDFENEFIDVSKDLIKNKYPGLRQHLNSSYTYIFELIHPISRVVVDYNGAEKLVLTGIRNLKNNNLLTYDECKIEADRLGLEIVEMCEGETIDSLIEKASTLKKCNKEGWILRIITDDEDVIIKLKLDDYSLVHKTVLSDIKPIQIFELIQNESLDDVIAKVENIYNREKILVSSENILSLLNKIEDSLTEKILYIENAFNVKQENVSDNVKCKESNELLSKRIDIVNYISNNLMDYYDKIGSTKYFIKGQSIDSIMKSITKKEFRQICEKYNLDIL